MQLLAGTLRRQREATAMNLRRSVDVAYQSLLTSVDMRYAGQNYEVEVPVPDGEFTDKSWEELLVRFAGMHRAALWLCASGRTRRDHQFARDSHQPRTGSVVRRGRRRRSPTGGAAHRPLRRAGRLPDLSSLRAATGIGRSPGPAVIEETDSTTLVFPGDEVHVGAGRRDDHQTGGEPEVSAKLDLDVVGLHVLHNALANIAAEMAIVMMKTSYSTIFNEGLDFSTMLAGPAGQHHRREELRTRDDGSGQLHAALDAGRAGRGILQARRRRSSITIPIAATAIFPNTC